jgi:hypothetical protein
MGNLKAFNPDDVDETLTKVVTHGSGTYLLFPFIHAVSGEPKYSSVGTLIKGPAATVDDFKRLTALITKAAEQAVWRIVFSTPWLVNLSEAQAPQRERRN